jgi:hypothetical protein
MKSNKITLVAISLIALNFSVIFSSCKKPTVDREEKTYPSEILQAWINFDLRLLRANPAVLNNFIMVQQWAYSSIALYEATLAQKSGYQTLSGQLDQMPSMPATTPKLSYHSPTIANAVMAAMKRYYYSNISAADKTSTDSLEAAFNTRYQTEVDAETFQRSVDYGKAIAQKVIDWSKTDGSLTVHPTYVLPVAPGQWEKTPPGLLAPQNPFWSTNRSLMPGSIAAAQIPPPPAYSTDPSSEFYKAAKEVYDISQTLTAEQMDQVIFWRDVPGGGHAHWLAIFSQVLNKAGNNAMLDKAVLVYVKMGITQSDARIATWKAKYTYNLLRPVTYIRSVMAKPTWNSYITTPNHPEYPSAHSSFSVPAAAILTKEFGDNYIFSDHTYDFLGLKARSFNSFNHAVKDAGDSRVVGGLHYRFAIDGGEKLGNAIVKYMEDKIRFKK